MSNPANILDKYRSHSIHYILTVSNETENIRKILNPQTSESNGGFLSNIVGKRLGDDIGNNVYLLVDSRKTSEFSIPSVSFTTLMGAKSDPAQTAIIGGTVDIQIVDPSGIGFFNYLRYLTFEKLNTDLSGLCFCLHIMFVGHTDDGGSEIVSTTGIPLMMNATFEMSEYTTRGAIYNLAFCASSMQIDTSISSISSIPNAISYEIKDSLLGNAIQSFENQLNIASRTTYLKYNPTILDASETYNEPQVKSTKKDEPKRNGRLVQYMITIPEHWFYFTIPTAADRNQELKFDSNGKPTNVPGKNASDQKLPGSHAVTSPSTTAQEAIANLLHLSPEVTGLFNADKQKNGSGKLFKIATSVTSNSDVMLIHFDIIEYSVPNVNKTKGDVEDTTGVSNDSVKSTVQDSKIPPKEGSIEFDYIFSGKNTDIIDFSIHVENMFIGLMTRTFSPIRTDDGSVKIDFDQKKKDDISPEIKDQDVVVPQQGKNQPIMPFAQSGKNLDNNSAIAKRNIKDSQKSLENSQEFHKALADLHFASLNNTIKIRGNPWLFSSFMVDSVAPHTQLTTSLKDYLNNVSAEKISKLSAWEYDIKSKSTPKGNGSIVAAHIEHRKYVNKLAKSEKISLAEAQYAKVNIFGPKDYPFSSDIDLPEFKVQLFYDGWYWMSAVKHDFVGSSFTQEITMHALDVYGDNSSFISNMKSQNVATSQNAPKPITKP